jgi:penicillin-binding protein 2
VADLERIAGTNLMPAYLKRLQYKTDSIRAQDWFKRTKDSAYIKKYFSLKNQQAPVKKQNRPLSRERNPAPAAALPGTKWVVKALHGTVKIS